MTAQEMFEKLGYGKTFHDDYEIVYSAYNGSFKEAEIEFDLEEQTFYCTSFDAISIVDMSVLKAINQQVKELGWL